MSIIDLNSDNFDTETQNGTVLVDFWAGWCMPCKMLAPIIEELSESVQGIKFCKVDTDAQQELAARYNIMSIPTVIVFRSGTESKRLVGVYPKQSYEELLSDS